MIYLFIIIGILILLVTTLPPYDTSREGFSSDEAIQNLASLYNQSNLTVTQITTPKIIGQSGLTINGNVAIPGTISSPSLDTINSNLTNQLNQINQLANRITNLENNYVKKGPINLFANYTTDPCGMPGNSRPITISDNWFLRAYPIDGATNCKAQFSIG